MEKELAAEEAERQVKIKTCGSTLIQLVRVGEVEQVTEDGVRRSNWTLDYEKTWDCRWYGHNIDIYSNGDFSHIIGRIFDTGTFYGDRFQCTITFFVANRPVVVWDWGEGPYCGTGETKTNLLEQKWK